jgi:hypothetical protein
MSNDCGSERVNNAHADSFTRAENHQGFRLGEYILKKPEVTKIILPNIRRYFLLINLDK